MKKKRESSAGRGDPYRVGDPDERPAWKAIPLIRFEIEEALAIEFSAEADVLGRAISVVRAVVQKRTGRRIPSDAELDGTAGSEGQRGAVTATRRTSSV